MGMLMLFVVEMGCVGRTAKINSKLKGSKDGRIEIKGRESSGDHWRTGPAYRKCSNDCSNVRMEKVAAPEEPFVILTMEALAKCDMSFSLPNAVNLQGDEVAMPPELIDQVAKLLIFSDGCNMATLCEPMLSEHDIDDKNIVKVVFNMNKSALYFSRIPIPYHKVDSDKEYYRHIGIYAYRAGFLKLFSGWAASELEKRESLEQLRALDHGQQILIEKACAVSGISVDTKGDLERARQLIKNNN